MVTKRLFIGIWLLSIIGSISVIPYVYFMGLIPESISLATLVVKNIINSALIYGIICWISYLLLKKVDFKPFSNSNSLANILFFGVLSGMIVGLIIIFSNKLFFQNSLLNTVQAVPVWAGALASIYGSINEEVFCRLFLLTLIYFMLSKIMRNIQYRYYSMWISIIVVSLIFGIGHLPAAFQIITPSSFEIFRILFLNTIGGIVFGWLYCRRGFWTAVVAHFIADLMIHVFLQLC